MRGACCLPDGSCRRVTREDCLATGGTWDDYFTVCTGCLCGGEPGLGACCLPDGVCLPGTPVDICADLGGVYHDCLECEQVECVTD
jgi:hypothetical protein